MALHDPKDWYRVDRPAESQRRREKAHRFGAVMGKKCVIPKAKTPLLAVFHAFHILLAFLKLCKFQHVSVFDFSVVLLYLRLDKRPGESHLALDGKTSFALFAIVSAWLP